MNLKRNRENFEVNLYHNVETHSFYNNIIDKDPQKIAQIFIDLMIYGFPIEKAIKIFKKRVSEHDWIGF